MDSGSVAGPSRPAESGAGRLKVGRPRTTTSASQAPQPLSPTPTAVTTMSAKSTTSTAPRKVRTVPPSAVLDPPTPPGESQPTFDTARIEPTKRRRRRFRSYWSSDEECSSSDADSDSASDDEPPWWTFTQRGMAKLRSREARPSSPNPMNRGSLSEVQNDSAPGSDADSGRESVRAGPSKRKARHRMHFSSAASPPRQNSGGSATPTRAAQAASRLFHPRPLRAAWNRRSTDTTAETPPSADGHGIPRSTSAPIPEGEAPAGILAAAATSRVSSPERQDATEPDTDTPVASPKRRPTVHRFLSMPQRRSHDDATLTDSEATMAGTSPRVRAKQRLWTIASLAGPVAEEDGPEAAAAAESDTGVGSTRPRPRRLNTHNLRLRLPTPVSEHFAGGWPHAGSWQDALHYGFVDEEGDRVRRRHSHDQSNVLVAEPESLPNGNGDGNGNDSVNGNGHSNAAAPKTTSVHGSVSGHRTSVANDTDTSAAGSERPRLHLDLKGLQQPPRAKQKSRRRTRRYRPAMVPPTPGAGLMFPNGQKNVIGAESWGNNQGPTPDPETNPFDRVNPFDRIEEEYPLSDNERMTEKKSRPFGRRRRPSGRPLDSLSWRKRMRRMLFLDARVTIYIRLVNIAIAVTLLALAVSIRLKLNNLDLRGIIGPSTTLIISYSSLTIVHVLTAIYREYFGRPIGLWGLRSKMLWVCLDLLFIALWSSAATLAINDYIDTPLDCTPLTPWWSHGQEYADVPTLALGVRAASGFERDTPVPEALKMSAEARAVCRRQVGCFAVSLVALLLYCGNMVLSLFRIFETVRRTANPIRTVSV